MWVVELAAQVSALGAQQRIDFPTAHEPIELRQGLALAPAAEQGLDADARGRFGLRMARQKNTGLRGGANKILARQGVLRVRELTLALRERRLGETHFDVVPLIGREPATLERRAKILDRAREVAELAAEKSPLCPQCGAGAPARREPVGFGDGLARASGARQGVDQRSGGGFVIGPYGRDEPRRSDVRFGLGGDDRRIFGRSLSRAGLGVRVSDADERRHAPGETRDEDNRAHGSKGHRAAQRWSCGVGSVGPGGFASSRKLTGYEWEVLSQTSGLPVTMWVK